MDNFFLWLESNSTIRWEDGEENPIEAPAEGEAVLAGLEVVFTEEAYTSQASFLDRDPLPAYEKGVGHVFSGKRVKRGLYRSADGREVNADVNGSCNIGRKVIGNEDLFLRLDKSLAARPVRINPLKAFCV